MEYSRSRSEIKWSRAPRRASRRAGGGSQRRSIQRHISWWSRISRSMTSKSRPCSPLLRLDGVQHRGRQILDAPHEGRESPELLVGVGGTPGGHAGPADAVLDDPDPPGFRGLRGGGRQPGRWREEGALAARASRLAVASVAAI